MPHRVRRLRGPVLLALGLVGCDRGCAATWLRAHPAAREALTKGAIPLNAVDCPDGLARCEEGVVSVSRLATLPSPCHGPPQACECPWERAATCPAGCAADGVELVVERPRVAEQLCAPAATARPFVLAPPLATPSPSPCDEGDRYECRGADVVECASREVVVTCARGCARDGGAIDEDGVSRVAAFALLCSR